MAAKIDKKELLYKVALVAYSVGVFLHVIATWAFSLSGRYGMRSCNETAAGCTPAFIASLVAMGVGLVMAILGYSFTMWLRCHPGGKPWIAMAAIFYIIMGALCHLIAVIVYGTDVDDVMYEWLGTSFCLSAAGAALEFISGLVILYMLTRTPKKEEKENDQVVPGVVEE